ncbi:tRNA-queuosine alpha-mannosyltransferase domain-containing protein [Pseudomaricurvus alcaniphilus]|uniref:tRNA-queuosine alpha-mannosyltransferase domain-containing protein n=1 Tax=Pseudomaricurvus alcaniphilus TaxID=1166482 RepID=UPI001A9D7081
MLLLSAYHAASHAHWCRGLMAAFPDYQWTLLSLPGRYFSWRVRGNSLSWAWQERRTLEQDYDLLIATSMVDLSALRGFVPKLAALPTIVYFHENQFAYPLSGQAFASVEPQILNVYTALCADRILFNSAYNLHSFVDGARQLLARLPDQVPAGIIEHIASRSQVLPVPLDNDWFDNDDADTQQRQGAALTSVEADGCKPLTIAWCGRHEYDKGPERLFAILSELESSSLDYRLVILGQQFKNSPPEFARIKQQFAHRLLHFGYAQSRADYRRWLRAADIVLSTALHEFQGLAVMEAVASGCVPVLPDRLAYPEWAPAWSLYSPDSIISNAQSDAAAEIAAEARAAATLISSASTHTAPDLSAYSWQAMQSRYAQSLLQTAAMQGAGRGG